MTEWMPRDQEIITVDGVVIGRTYPTSAGPVGDREMLDNARLMAAAPKLLASLEWAMRQIGHAPRRIRGQNDGYCDAYAAMENAITTAKGTTK